MAKRTPKTDQSIISTIGAGLVLVGSMAVRDASLAFFLTGLALLAIQTLDLSAVAPKKLDLAQLILSASLCVAAITQLVMAKGFRAPQMFLVVLLIGAILVVVEAGRRYAER